MNEGSRISLISKSEIRYEGFLHAINAEENTVALKNVRMYGTEGRKGDPSQEIAPGDQMYDFIIFRGADIKDLTVYESAPKDPAIVRSKLAEPSAPAQPASRNNDQGGRRDNNNNYNNNNNGGGYRGSGGYNSNNNYNNNYRGQQNDDYNNGGGYGGPRRRDNYGGGGGYNRGGYGGNYGGGYHRGGGGGGYRRENNYRRDEQDHRPRHHGGHHGGQRWNQDHTGFVPATKEKLEFKEEFDFSKANAAFEAQRATEKKDDVDTKPTGGSKGFFDNISSESSHPSRTRPTAAERELDKDTFGESAPRGGGRGRGGHHHQRRGGYNRHY